MDNLKDFTLATCDIISCDIHEEEESLPVISLPGINPAQSGDGMVAAVGQMNSLPDPATSPNYVNPSYYGQRLQLQDDRRNLHPANSETESDCSDSKTGEISDFYPSSSQGFCLSVEGVSYMMPCASDSDSQSKAPSEKSKRPRGRPKGTTVAAGFRVSAGRPPRKNSDSVSSPEQPNSADSSVQLERKAGKRGRPKGSTAVNGYKVSSGRPKGTTRQNGFRVSNGRPSTKGECDTTRGSNMDFPYGVGDDSGTHYSMVDSGDNSLTE